MEEKQDNLSRKKSRYIKTAGIISLLGNAGLAVLKIVIGIVASSIAILGDGIDSSTDVLISIVTLIISTIIALPSDKEHPWGHQRAETVATMVLSFIIFYAGAQLCVQSIQKLVQKDFATEISFLAIGASLVSIFGKTILCFTQKFFAKKADSEILKANAQNMKNDIIMSSGVLIGLLLSHFLSLPILDPVIAIAVGLWVIKNAIEIFMEQNMELMDGNADSELYKKLFNAVASVRGVTNPHSARIRKMASMFDIDLDIEVAPSMPLYEAHELSEQVEEAIRKEIPEAYAVTIHIEPLDSCTHQRAERFGLSPENVQD